MGYRFEISQPERTDFRCEIAIDGDQTFQQFHDKIVETLGYDSSQMASFFALDKMGNRSKEIALMEMSDDDEESNILVMDVTTIREVVNASCLELEYVYDMVSGNFLRVEYAGRYEEDSADVLPVCVSCTGHIPHQSSFDDKKLWKHHKEDDDYDDTYLEEFGEESRSSRRGGRRRDEEEDFGFGEEEDGYGDENYEDDGLFDDRFENLDDYIDKL